MPRIYKPKLGDSCVTMTTVVNDKGFKQLQKNIKDLFARAAAQAVPKEK